MLREAYWRPAKETDANVNSSEYTLFTQSHRACEIVLWSVKSQGNFVILMGGNPVEPLHWIYNICAVFVVMEICIPLTDYSINRYTY